jgi:hypothetical protein
MTAPTSLLQQQVPDVWIRAAVKPDGFEYYEMLLVYVDDISVIAFDPKLTMDAIGKLYRLKEGLVGPPEQYFGAKLSVSSCPKGLWRGVSVRTNMSIMRWQRSRQLWRVKE